MVCTSRNENEDVLLQDLLLHDAARTFANIKEETESIGISILRDLRSQRETIQHATGTLQRANEGLARSKRMLTAISRRAFANKMIM